jgi:hypothetical protein
MLVCIAPRKAAARFGRAAQGSEQLGASQASIACACRVKGLKNLQNGSGVGAELVNAAVLGRGELKGFLRGQNQESCACARCFGSVHGELERTLRAAIFFDFAHFHTKPPYIHST